MDKQIPEEQQNQEAPVIIKSNNHLIIIFAIIAIIGFSAASAMAGYFFATRTLTTTNPGNTQPNTKACTMEAKVCPDGTSVGRTGPNCEFAACPVTATPQPAVSPIPTLKPNPSGNTYRSEKNNVAFYYASKTQGSNETIEVSELGNKIYVYPKGMEPTKGQSVEIFTKDPAITFEQAISNQFLKGISPDVCFVQKEKSTDANIVKATIAYPVPANSDEPSFMFGDACPANYKRTNGMAYFYYDIRVPAKFFFFSIGQYGINAYSNSQNTMWQDTFAAY
jgi:hypothetical protein